MKFSKTNLILILFLLTGWQLSAQDAPNPWTEVSESAISRPDQIRHIIPQAYQTFGLDLAAMGDQLVQAPLRFGPQDDKKVFITLPRPDGRYADYRIWYAPVMHPDLAAKYPEIRTYVGQGVDDKTAIVKLDLTPHGFHAMIRSAQHSTVFIDPYAKGNTQHYISYYKKDFVDNETDQFVCHLDEVNDIKETDLPGAEKVNGDCNLRTYRLALACTGEYAQFHGGTVSDALAAMNTSMNRVNGIFETDITVTMQIIPNNDQIIFLDSATDPYNNGSGFQMLGQNQTTCDNIIGTANYDIGHVFSTGGGGVASLQSVCSSGSKARGVTGQGTPVGDPFDVDYVAHEIGHQFGGRHTQNNNCNRDNVSSYEPGSASTIMGYAGICSPNVQNNSDDFFHINSVVLMSNFANGGGNSCAAVTNTGNNAPTADAGTNHIIPASTPFVLEGTGTDADGDMLTYCWEQYDKEVAPQPPQPTNTDGPAFRSLDPVISPDRYLPNLNDLVNNTSNTWEVLSSVSRSYTWRLTVRDNNPGAGCTDDDEILVNVDGNTGPFLVTAPNTAVTWTGGENQMITWDVAGTTGGAVNTPNVDIFLSTDGGFTYPINLATSVSNDGSHTIAVPDAPTSNARIMVRGSGNIFFDISDQDFTILPAPGDYLLTVLNETQTVCQSEEAQYNILIESIDGFDEAVTLGLLNLPPGANPQFSQNPVTAPGTSTLTILNTENIPPGTYAFTLTATGSTGNQTADLEITVLSGAPAPPIPTAPENGATMVDLTPTLEWLGSPGASNFGLEIADNEEFINPVLEVSGIPDEFYTVPDPLAPNTTHYWRVFATNGCGDSPFSETYTFTTNTEGGDLTVEVTTKDVSCFGETDGTATAMGSGGTGNYSYEWSTGATTPMISGLEPGDYSVTLSDGFAMVSTTVTINEPDPFAFDFVVTDAVDEMGGAVDLTVSGGTPDYTFSWSNGATTEDLTDVGPGTYEVVVTDANDCVGQGSVTVGNSYTGCDIWIPLSVQTTNNEATVNWYVYQDAQRYFLRYRVAGTDDPWQQVSVLHPEAELTLTGLEPETTYEYQALTKCQDGSVTEWSDELYEFTTGDAMAEDCSSWVPTEVNTNNTNAQIIWDPVPGATAYRIAYAPAGSSDYTRITLTNTMIALSDLTPGTDYEFFARTLCPDGWTSWEGPYNFTTTNALLPGLRTDALVADYRFRIFPNPVDEVLEVMLPDQVATQWMLFDNTGRTLRGGALPADRFELPVGDLPPGMYVFVVRYEDGQIASERFVKK